MRATVSAITAVVIAAVLAAPTADAQRRARGRAGGCSQTFATHFVELQSAPLTQAETTAVADLREEEKLARDVYLTLAEQWQLPVFSRIATAEQRHMNHVAMLLAEYQLPDPIVDDTVGVFTNHEYARLYTDLTTQGQTSLEQALQVGATIEDLDLADLENLLGLSDNPHIGLVAHNLAKGSRNHLRAFVSALEARDQTYSAQYLDQGTVDQILASARERGTIYDENGDVLASCGSNGRGGRRGGPGVGQAGCAGNGSSGGPGNGPGSGDGSCGAPGRGGN
jgi:hypothetical protein